MAVQTGPVVYTAHCGLHLPCTFMDTTLHASPDPAPSRSRAEAVYLALRNELLLGKLGHSRLVEETLAERYSTSRTPVREALRRLEGDGHVERHPSMGLIPSLPRVDEMRELYDVRIALEELVARRLTTSPPEEALGVLLARWQEMSVPQDLPSFVHTDESFHVGLAEASRHTVATDLLRDINDRIRVLRIHDFTAIERIKTTIHEHVQILSALLEGDPAKAVPLLRGNIEHSAAVVEQRVGEALARMFAVAPEKGRT